MVRKPVIHGRKQCEVCGVEIPKDRKAEMPRVSICVQCQKESELRKGPDHKRDETGSDSSGMSTLPEGGSVEVKGNLVLLGNWSGNLIDLAAREGELRQLLAIGDVDRARALVQALPVEEQAALVAMSEEPEEMLSMTGGDGSGGPGYSRQVVELLPTEILGSLISVDPDEWKFNTELIRAMSPPAFRRAMAETLDRVDNSSLRTRVSWEWLQALATLDDFNHRTELLRALDQALLEDALLDRLAHLDLNEVVGVGGFQVYRFRLFSTEGLGGTRPSAFIDDPETGLVLDALYEASPAMLSNIIRVAWERGENDDEEEIVREPRKQESAEDGEQGKGRTNR
jgi:hypothetical protein